MANTTVSCKYCQGLGRARENDKIIDCPACGGSGSVNVPTPKRSCKKCHGLGRMDNTPGANPRYIRCTVCRGTGWFLG